MVIKDSFQPSILNEIIEENELDSIDHDINDEVKNEAEYDDSIDNERCFIKANNSVKSNQESRKNKLDTILNDCKDKTSGDTLLEVGIIDYCAVFGPASPFTIMQPSHYVTSTGIIASLYNSKETNKKTSSPDSNSTTRNLNNKSGIQTLLRSDSNNGNVYGLFCNSEDEQEIIMWDRLPRHNHPDIELPSKIEWFACPEGSKTVLYPYRPNPFFQSFVLSSGGETEEIFGLSINFFIALYNSKNNSDTILSSPTAMSSEDHSIQNEYVSPNNNNNNDYDEIPWWRRIRNMNIDTNLQTEIESNSSLLSETNNNSNSNNNNNSSSEQQQNNKEELTLWTAVSFCVLFRSSNHVQQLRKCLELGYFESILPNLIQWEDNWKVLYEYYLPNEQEVGIIERNNELNFKIIKPFSLYMEKLIATLCLECPTPIPGFLKVSIKLKVGNESLQDKLVLASKVDGKRGGRIRKNSGDSSSSNDSFLCRDPIHKSILQPPPFKEPVGDIYNSTKEIEFHAPLSEDFPRCSYGIEVLLKCFGPRALIDIVCCVLSESRMLFHSADLSLLPVICEGLRTLIYPLQWSHVYLPVLPMQLLSVVEAPVPFMLGTHTKWLKHIQIEYMQDMVLIDCDTASIDMGGSTALKFPAQEDRWLMMTLKTILQPVLLNDDVHELNHPFILREEGDEDDNYDDYDVIEESHSFFNSINIFSSTNPHHHITDPATQIQLVFYDVLFHLLRYVPDCFIYSNPTCPVFNLSLFMSEYASVEYKSALEVITLTSCFHVLTESIHSPSLAFFYENIIRIKQLENDVNDGSTKAFESSQVVFSDSIESLASTECPVSPSTRFNKDNNNNNNESSIKSSSNRETDRSDAANYDAQSNEDFNSVHVTDRKSVKHVSVSDVTIDITSNVLCNDNIQYSNKHINEHTYSGLFPLWILTNNKKQHNHTQNKVESIRRLLEKRLEYYQPYLRHHANNVNKLSNNNDINTPITCHKSIDTIRQDSFNQDNNLFNFAIEIEDSNIQHHLVVCTDYTMDLEQSLTFNTMLETEAKQESKLYKHFIKQNIIKNDPKSINIINNDMEQLKPNHYLIEFNNELLSLAQQQVKRWTVANLAEELQIPIETMIVLYNRNHTHASSKLEENTQFAARRRSIKHVNQLNKKEVIGELDVNEFELK